MANHLPCGIELPQVFFDGPIDMGHVRNFAVRAEHLGYDSLWLQERIIGDVNMLEPVTLLSYVAAITSRLKLGTSVILLPLRNPIQLAKAYATLDVMSEGRAVMGRARRRSFRLSRKCFRLHARRTGNALHRSGRDHETALDGAEGQLSRAVLEFGQRCDGAQADTEAAVADHFRRPS